VSSRIRNHKAQLSSLVSYLLFDRQSMYFCT